MLVATEQEMQDWVRRTRAQMAQSVDPAHRCLCLTVVRCGGDLGRCSEYGEGRCMTWLMARQ